VSEHVLTVKETDIVSLRDAVNTASGGARASWLGFLGLTAYLFVAVASVSHMDLLINAPVSLPLLQVNIPLNSFFLYAPLVFVAVHFGVLVQHVLLTQKVAILHDLLSDREPEHVAQRSEFDPIRYTLDSYFITQAIAGPARRTLLAIFLENLTWLSLVIVPVLLLLAFQIAFLPYHDAFITWAHRLVLLVELVVIVLLGAYLGASVLRFSAVIENALRRRPVRLLFALFVAIAASVFSVFVATIPGERMERWAQAFSLYQGAPGTPSSPWFTAILFEGRVNPITGRATSPFLRNLVVPDADFATNRANGVEANRLLNLRGRDLRFATLDRSNLKGADLTGADLRQASLQGANLEDAMLTSADLRGALFWREGEQDVDFVAADLSGASLRRARLDSANLHGVRARGTDFSGARLIGATFLNADLQGADFQAANLIAASFVGANLDASRLKNTKLDAARFERARLVGADLSNSALFAVQFKGANLTGADMRGGPVWATDMPKASEGLDMSYRVAMAPNDRHLAWLKAQIDTAWTPDGGIKLRASIGNLRDKAAQDAWKETAAFRAWNALRTEPPWSKERVASLTRVLSRFACEDRTDNAVVASGIARRASETFLFAPQFNGDLIEFQTAVRSRSCLDVASRMSSEVHQALRRAARLAEDAKRHNNVSRP